MEGFISRAGPNRLIPNHLGVIALTVSIVAVVREQEFNE